MHHYQIRLVLRFFEELRHRAKNKRIADSVEPVFAQSVRFGHFLVDRVRFDVFGEGLVECAIKVGDAPDTGEFFATCPDDLQSREVVSDN